MDVNLSKTQEKVCKFCGSGEIRSYHLANGNYICKCCHNRKQAKYKAKKVSTKRGLEFDLSAYSAFQQTQFYLDSCPVCARNVAENNLSLTIDRIDSSKGYCQGNMQIMCYDCNQIKSDRKKDFWDTLPDDYIERLKRASV